LSDGSGKEVPAQFEELAKWPDGSLKSVLVILNAEPSSSYRLHYGPGIKREKYKTDLTYTDDGKNFIVTTGPIRFKMNRNRFALFDGVWIDSKGDKKFQDSERLIDPATSF
jgi:hypothetical protein